MSQKVRMCIIGDKNVGKTTLIAKLIKADYLPIENTIGVEFNSKVFSINNKTIKLLIWDISGDPVYKGIEKTYFTTTDIFVIVLNTLTEKSLNSLSFWVDNIFSYKILKHAIISVIILKHPEADLEKVLQCKNIINKLNFDFYEIETDNDIEKTFKQITTLSQVKIYEKKLEEKLLTREKNCLFSCIIL